jgi:hypothetical protein
MNEILNNIEDKDLVITFKKKKITFNKVKLRDKKKIIKIWEDTRNQYLKILNKIKTNKINNKFVQDFFNWEGTSSWWFSLLELKDTETYNHWYKKFFLVNLLIHYKKNIKIYSDDKFINKFIKKNFKKISLTDLTSISFNNLFLNTFNLVKNILSRTRNWLLFSTIKMFTNYNENLNINLWALSLYPANWPSLGTPSQINNDRFFDGFFQQKSHLKKKYLLLFTKYPKDKRNFFKDFLDIKKKISDEYLFLDSYISLNDLFKIYISTFKEYYIFLKLKKNRNFNKNFNYKGFDISHIFFEEMEKSFFGFIQNAKYGGLSIKNFLNKKKISQNFITYTEIIADIRPIYFFIKKHSTNNKIITLQHAIHTKDKMIVNHNKIDFIKSKNNRSMLDFMPDLYLTQGTQFKKILSEYFPGNIKIVGSLKYDNYKEKIYSLKKNSEIIKKKLKIKKNIKIILIAPSTHDSENIFQILQNFNPGSNWKIILSPHPATNFRHLIKDQLLNYPNLNIRYINDIKTIDLVCVADIVISSASSISLEALIFKKQSIRLFDLGNVPIFEKEKSIPTFFTSEEFNFWFNKNYKKNYTKKYNRVIKKYFYKIDGKTSKRFENNLKKIINF